MPLRILICAFLVLGMASADTLTLKNGKVVEGTFLSGDSREVRMAVGNRVDTYQISEVSGLQFGRAAAATPAAAHVAAAAPVTVAAPVAPALATPRAARRTGKEVPAGHALVVRMIDDIDSERDRLGQTFRASIDEPVVVNGETVIPRGADVLAKLVDDKQAGRLSGRTELTIDLVSVTVNGQAIDVLTQSVTQASESRGNQTARRAGGLAAAGAVIGAIAGGGKGAAIGAVTGAGAGGAVQVFTKGQKVKIPSESRLEFTLQQPMRL